MNVQQQLIIDGVKIDQDIVLALNIQLFKDALISQLKRNEMKAIDHQQLEKDWKKTSEGLLDSDQHSSSAEHPSQEGSVGGTIPSAGA